MDGTSPHQRTSVVTVSYRSGGQIKEMLDTLPAGTPTVIVNNAPEDEHALRESIGERGSVTLVSNPSNAGFGVACNIGAGQITTEFVLFLNPDARLKPGCIEGLEDCADSFPQAVAFNPAMTDGQGKPFFKRSSVLLPNDKHLPRSAPSQTQTVSVLSGAALFVRKVAFDQVGGFDEKIFLYHEDDDLSIRLSKRVGDLMFVQSAEATHAAGHSTPRSPEVAALKAYNMGWSRVYASRKHGVPFARSRALLSATFQLLNPVVCFSARKRAKQVAFFRGVISAISQAEQS